MVKDRVIRPRSSLHVSNQIDTMPPRRAHTKSRNGCDQCKKRRVKVSTFATLKSTFLTVHSVMKLGPLARIAFPESLTVRLSKLHHGMQKIVEDLLHCRQR